MQNNYEFQATEMETYRKKLKKQITIRLDQDVISYFKQLSEKNGIPYQNLINLYLKDCAKNQKELNLSWQ